ncbi:MAG: PhzF family phenazine biosynthesis protein [Rhodospirillales bacterium]|nr:PhzF family phenazine biosynthesis protein [Rhodospirillales bacterium]
MSQTLPLYQIDSFATEVFRGNPAAVCVLDVWPTDDVMQAVAAENNLSETAFLGPDKTGTANYELRWFTPKAEVDLCGHATLATAWVLFFERGHGENTVRFLTKSGILTVARGDDGVLTMDFPQNKVMPAPHPEELLRAFGHPVLEFCKAKNGMVLALIKDAPAVRQLEPVMRAVAELSDHGLIVTAPGGGDDGDVDFVSRFFAPRLGIPEDPVTGSAHTVLAPYWARRLGKTAMRARQVSRRGGDLGCEIEGERVKISGRAVLFMKGEMVLP